MELSSQATTLDGSYSECALTQMSNELELSIGPVSGSLQARDGGSRALTPILRRPATASWMTACGALNSSDHPLLRRDQSIDPRRLAVEVVGDGPVASAAVEVRCWEFSRVDLGS